MSIMRASGFSQFILLTIPERITLLAVHAVDSPYLKENPLRLETGASAQDGRYV
jgi:hypothetical protein